MTFLDAGPPSGLDTDLAHYGNFEIRMRQTIQYKHRCHSSFDVAGTLGVMGSVLDSS